MLPPYSLGHGHPAQDTILHSMSRSKMPPTYCCQPNPLSAASKRAHHIGPLDGPAHVLVFRAKECPRDVSLLVSFAANILEAIAGNVDLVVDVAGVEPTVWRVGLGTVQEVDIPKPQVLFVIRNCQRGQAHLKLGISGYR